MKTKSRSNAKPKTTAGNGNRRRASKKKPPIAQNKRPSIGAKSTFGQIAAILEHISDGFLAFDAQMNYTYVNEKGGELLGRKPADLIGKNYWKEYPEAKGTPFANAYVRALETRQPIVIEDYYAPWDRWFENRIYPSKDGLAILFTEITKRKRAEENLAEQERLIRAVADTTPAIIYVYDMALQANVYSNNGIQRILGYPPQEIQAMGADLFANIVHPDDLPEVIAFQQKILDAADDDTLEIEYRMKRRHAGWRNLRSFERPFLRNADGSVRQKIGVAIDITEHKRAEDALHVSEERLRLSTELANVAVWEYDFIANNMSRSKNHDGLYGLDWQDKWDMNVFLNATHPDDRAYSNEMIQRAVAPGGPDQYTFDFRAVYPDRSIHWLMVVGQVMERNAEGQGIIVRGSLIDITERKRAEEELRKSEQKFSVIFDKSAFVAALSRLPDGLIANVNEAFEKIFGFTKQEAIGKTSLEVGFNPDAESRARVLATLQTQGAVRDVELELRTKSGEARIFSVNVDLVNIGGEKFILNTMQDITERKQAEEKLRLSNERFANAFNISPAGLTITRIANGKFIDVNEAFLRMFEFTRDETIGHTSTELNILGPDQRAKLIQAQIESGGLRNAELMSRSKSGRLIHILFSSKPMELEGETHHITTLIDITERKRAEDELRLSRDRLADLSRQLVNARETENRAIGRELHDQIGQMLTALKLTLEIAPQLPSGQAAKKIAQARELTDDLLNRVSRLSLELRPSMLDDLGLIPALLWHIQRFEEQTRIEVDFKHSGVAGKRFYPELETTAYRIVQESLTNVARHAHATQVRIDVRATEERMDIHIEDNGAGFDPQIALAKNRGLSGMRERVQLLGGAFQVESKAGVGTKKFIQLPIEEKEP